MQTNVIIHVLYPVHYMVMVRCDTYHYMVGVRCDTFHYMVRVRCDTYRHQQSKYVHNNMYVTTLLLNFYNKKSSIELKYQCDKDRKSFSLHCPLNSDLEHNATVCVDVCFDVPVFYVLLLTENAFSS